MKRMQLMLTTTTAVTVTTVLMVSAYAQDKNMTNMNMGAVSMTGTVSMNGRQFDMKCDMQPKSKMKAMPMPMDKPVKMNGTMTMMGQEYRCDMSMTPKKTTPIGTPVQSGKMTDQELIKEFKDADKNHDGYVDFNELVIHEGGDKNRAKLHMTDADRNKDGRVDQAEWIRHHKESLLHKNKDGTMKM